MEKTAVEWLINELTICDFINVSDDFEKKYLTKIINQSKDIFELQIIDAYLNGINSDCMSHEDSVGYANEYYNKNFK